MAYLKMIPSLSASDNDETKPRMIKPEELDIYFKPQSTPVIDTPQKSSLLFNQVSGVRKYLWRFSGDFKNFYNKTTLRINSVKEKVGSAYDNAVNDPITMIRPGCITAAFIVGAVLPGRGKKKFLRLISATATGTAAAAVAYPKTASEVSVNAFNKGKAWGTTLVEYIKKKSEESRVKNVETLDTRDKVDEHSSETQGGSESDVASETDEAKNEAVLPEQGVPKSEILGEEKAVLDGEISTTEQQNDPVQDQVQIEVSEIKIEDEIKSDHDQKSADHDQLSSENIIEESAKSQESKPYSNVEGDYGQSNPEDKDMYSTRQ